VDNRNVVAYSPYFLQKYKCHINVEYCATVKSVKYLTFYPLKGDDLATIEVPNPEDEVSTFLTKRYISSCSACWRLYAFQKVKMHPPVMQLPVHLEDEQIIYYQNDKKSAINALTSTQTFTPLTAMIAINKDQENDESTTSPTKNFPNTIRGTQTRGVGIVESSRVKRNLAVWSRSTRAQGTYFICVCY